MQLASCVVIAAIAVTLTVAVPAPQGRPNVLNNTTMGSTFDIYCMYHEWKYESFPPLDVPDSSEVELIEPFNSGASDGSGKPVVVVVRPTSFGEVFAGFPGFGKFPGFHNFPRFGGAEDVPRPHQVSLDDLFGGDHEEPLKPSSNNCGLLCKVKN